MTTFTLLGNVNTETGRYAVKGSTIYSYGSI